MSAPRTRAISATERTGVLAPANLERFRAQWIAPADDVRDVVDTYWAVRWHLDAGERIEQRIIDHPSLTLSIEHGDVDAPFVVTSARSHAWTRTIAGHGDVFAIRLRPAGLAVLSDLDPSSPGPEQELTPALDARAHALLARIAAAPDPARRAGRADALVRAQLAERPLRASQRIANAALDALTAQPHVQRVPDVAAAVGTSERTLQRALRTHVGRGPGEIARRIRLQEVVRRLSAGEGDIPRIAVDLGYVDQAHLTNDFRRVAGVTPGAYVDGLVQTQAALRGRP
ncbi:helix-turn-helix transcriptional regulator [Microbacterium lushaniae]|nr:helix-turn-helix transcriptional regulator [Microbacterium lushaniae]KAA9154637.1 helix-turn-helix transcriptional regulator [Microbacterium lushaniae]